MDMATIDGEQADTAEHELVVRVAAGDARAFEVLMRRYNRRLYRTARSILKDDSEAEDAVQEGYWKAYQAMSGFRADAQLSTWLTRIVINESLGRLRRNKRRAEVIQSTEDLSTEIKVARMETTANIDERPDQMAWRAEIRTLIEHKLDTLPDAYRTVFMLRAVEGMPAVEVAAALDIPEATVRSRFFRARRIMRDALSDEVAVHTPDAFSFAGLRCDHIVETVLARLERERIKNHQS
ncbi:RNA polymerase sigma factor [Alcaligenaceae bacterium CGII-47]|nr:RNA polymerase sigma factor [Alcaligenaceae bacterium CGII-47]